MKPLASSLAALAILTASAPGAVIISQYYEGSSNNKWIELYNTSSTALDLSADNYRLGVWSNANREIWKTDGAPTSSFALTVTIPANGTALFANNSSTTAPAYAVSDQVSGAISFNGDDSVVLYTGSSYAFVNVVDAFGVTGSGYANTSYVRNADILTGTNADFAAADWTQFSYTDVDTADSANNEHLGTHVTVPEPNVVPLGALAFLAILLRRRTR